MQAGSTQLLRRRPPPTFRRNMQQTPSGFFAPLPLPAG